MKTIKRKSVGTHFSMCVQPAFILVRTMQKTERRMEFHTLLVEAKL